MSHSRRVSLDAQHTALRDDILEATSSPPLLSLLRHRPSPLPWRSFSQSRHSKVFTLLRLASTIHECIRVSGWRLLARSVASVASVARSLVASRPVLSRQFKVNCTNCFFGIFRSAGNTPLTNNDRNSL